jgi:hypothetical protein
MCPDQAWRDGVRGEADRVHESAQYSSATQFEYSKRWRRVDRLIGSASAALAAVAGIGGLSELLSVKWAGGIAVVAAGVGAVAASIGAPQTKEKAALAANAYRALQQDARIFINIDLSTMDEKDARQRLQQYVDRLQQLNAESEIPSQRAWKRGKKSIDKSGSQVFRADGK